MKSQKHAKKAAGHAKRVLKDRWMTVGLGQRVSGSVCEIPWRVPNATIVPLIQPPFGSHLRSVNLCYRRSAVLGPPINAALSIGAGRKVRILVTGAILSAQSVSPVQNKQASGPSSYLED